jgi:hypothetical protein
MARPSRKAADTRFHRTPAGCAGAVPCANAETASRSNATVVRIAFLFTPILLLS